MSAAERRRLIMQKSKLQRTVDPRPRCEDCGKVLTQTDFRAYWDGDPTLETKNAQPRCCERCAEDVN